MTSTDFAELSCSNSHVDELDANHIEPELLQPSPRQIPPQFWEGYHSTSKQRGGWLLVRIGGICMAIGSMSAIEKLADFIPLLSWLIWIGLLLVASAVCVFVDLWILKRRFKAFVHGKPVAVTIKSLTLAPATAHNGQVNSYKYRARCSVLHPRPSVPNHFDCESELISLAEKAKVTTTYRVGDTATAIYLPKDPAREMKLYGFLGLRPGLGIVERTDVKKEPLWAVCLGLFAILAMIGLPIWSLFAMNRFDPIESSPWQWLPTLLGGGLAGGGMLAAIAASNKGKRDKLAKQNSVALSSGEAIELGVKGEGALGSGGPAFNVMMVFGAFLMCGYLSWTIACTLNAALDRSNSQFVAVNILDREVDESILMRNHQVRYQSNVRAAEADPFAELNNKQCLAMSREAIEQLEDNGFAEVKQGFFGWQWVKAIHPHRPVGKK